MAVPQAAEIQTIEEISVLVTGSLFCKRPFSAIYQNHRRSLCPHAIGRNKDGELHVLCYQYAGGSASGLKPHGSPDNWRCCALGRLRGVKLLDEKWRSATNQSRPSSCIAEVLFEAR